MNNDQLADYMADDNMDFDPYKDYTDTDDYSWVDSQADMLEAAEVDSLQQDGEV